MEPNKGTQVTAYSVRGARDSRSPRCPALAGSYLRHRFEGTFHGSMHSCWSH